MCGTALNYAVATTMDQSPSILKIDGLCHRSIIMSYHGPTHRSMVDTITNFDLTPQCGRD